MLELYQREDCPASARVRHYLEARGMTYRAIPVPKLGADRAGLLALEGVASAEVPVLVDAGKVIQGADQILEHLRAEHDGNGFADPAFGLTRRLRGITFERAKQLATVALAEQGFGVLTEIDVKATLKKKIDADFRDYAILGACNPALAHQALEREPALGLLLPCNVVVSREEDGSVVVSAIDPVRMFSIIDEAGIEPVAKEVRARLVRALWSIDGQWTADSEQGAA